MRWITAIINLFFEIVLGCRHEKLTRPFTLENQTYMVCLDCGRQIYYSAESMRPLSSGELRRMRLAQSGGSKVGGKVVPLAARVRRLVGARSKSDVAA